MSAPTKQITSLVSNTCNVPSRGSADPISLIMETGKSIIIVGANGSGKTRLGAFIEKQLPVNLIQRIAAQKSLSLSDNITLVSLERAEQMLRYGVDNIPLEHLQQYRISRRWGGKPAVHLLKDFDALQQTLFAEQNATAVKHLHDRKVNPSVPIPSTRLEQLKDIWDHLLSHRKLEIREASIGVTPTDVQGAVAYPGSEMSDGERAIFYFLGQCLVAPKDGVIIIDEPETHVHKAVLGRLWDAAESARSDCAFVYMTHDLDFAADHVASTKYFIHSYDGTDRWDMEALPEDTGLPEHVVAELVGSRRPILFVEGERASLDLTIYGNVYQEFTVVPVGSCDNVIHAVGSYKKSKVLHRLGSVRGLIDADDRSEAEIEHLSKLDIYVLPVAEVDNLLALPEIFKCLAKMLLCSDPAAKLADLQSDIMCSAQKDIDLVCSRYTIRRVDRALKKVSIDAQDILTLTKKFSDEVANVDPGKIFKNRKLKLEAAIQACDLPGVLALYDNKGHVRSRVANRLGLAKWSELLDKLTRLIGDKDSPVRDVLIKTLPSISV